MAQRHSRGIPRVAFVALAAGVALLGSVLVLRARSADPVPAAQPAPGAGQGSLEALLAGSSAPELSPEPPSDPSRPAAQILTKTLFPDAFAIARPFMMNTAGRLDNGTAMLSLWAAERLTWSVLEALPETSPALFRKDPDAERGKRFCIAGSIIEIRAEKTLAGRIAEDRASPLIKGPSTAAPALNPPPSGPALADSSGGSGLLAAPLGESPAPGSDWAVPGGGKVYVAIIKEKLEPANEPGGSRELRRATPRDPLVVEIIAVKSTGKLVDGSDARACGILTGVTLPAGGAAAGLVDVTEHRIVGMFDLPENRGGGETAHQGG
jgi:hypothetical protein